MRKFFEIGGFIAAAVLIAIGVTAMVMAYNGRNTVHDSLAVQHIQGSPDMTPALITKAAKDAGLNVADLQIPSISVAGQDINTGEKAHAFAGYMQIHALEATGGQYYAQMPRYATADGKGTNDPALAVKVDGQPQENPARNIWINETALSTALQASYMADQLSMFGFVTGIALLLSGVGFGVLAAGLTLRSREDALSVRKHATGHTAVPVS